MATRTLGKERRQGKATRRRGADGGLREKTHTHKGIEVKTSVCLSVPLLVKGRETNTEGCWVRARGDGEAKRAVSPVTHLLKTCLITWPT